MIGRKRIAFDAAGAKRFAVRLNRAGRRRLKSRESVKVKLVAKTRDIALNRATARVTAPLG